MHLRAISHSNAIDAFRRFGRPMLQPHRRMSLSALIKQQCRSGILSKDTKTRRAAIEIQRFHMSCATQNAPESPEDSYEHLLRRSWSSELPQRTSDESTRQVERPKFQRECESLFFPTMFWGGINAAVLVLQSSQARLTTPSYADANTEMERNLKPNLPITHMVDVKRCSHSGANEKHLTRRNTNGYSKVRSRTTEHI